MPDYYNDNDEVASSVKDSFLKKERDEITENSDSCVRRQDQFIGA